MLIPSFFIPAFDTTEYFSGNIDFQNAYGVCKIKIGDNAQTKSLYHSLFIRIPKTPFCLMLELDDLHYNEVQIEEFIDYAISFTFNCKYLNLDFLRPFFFLKTPAHIYPLYIELLRKKFRAQGYADIDYVHLDASDAIGKTTVTGNWISVGHSSHTKDPISGYKEILESSANDIGFLLFYVNSPNHLNTLLKDIRQVEEHLSVESPHTYYLLHKNARSELKQKELQSEIILLKENIDSLKNYYTFYNAPDSGYKKKITEIVDFYKTEYEILPLWYKRFGHIIKVLMGKRTFRSLFDDNVKKYN